MRNKKIVATLLVLALMLASVGCANAQPTPQPLATPSTNQNNHEYEDNDYYEYYNENGYEGERYSEYEFADADVRLTISFDRQQYTHSDIVNMIATITNISDEIVVFTKGSGSNLVPDALRVELGQFTPLFIPAMMTMDLQTSVLEPGESATFELPFAPYMYAGRDITSPPVIGLDRDIEFFQSDEWARVEVGEIEGSIHFSYAVRSHEDEFFMIVEGDEIHVLEGSFTISLTENGQEAPNNDTAEENDENAGEADEE